MLVTIGTSRASRSESSATDPKLFFKGRNAYIAIDTYRTRVSLAGMIDVHYLWYMEDHRQGPQTITLQPTTL